MRGPLVETALPEEVGEISDIAPVNLEDRSVWLLLGRDGAIHRLDADSSKWTRLSSPAPIDEPGRQPWKGHTIRPHLHVSGTGEFAAVVNDYGRFGHVIDLRSREVTLRVDGGNYHPETVPFSFAFAEIGGHTHAIHRTEWNRLDVSDPASGVLITQRASTRFQGEEGPPEHYLDYFHGTILVSPDGRYVADDGWVWGPVGAPTVWSLSRWVIENAWESEDGPSKSNVCARHYYWDHGMAWLDASRLAIGGLGDDPDETSDGARIFDVTKRGSPTGDEWSADLVWSKEIITFPGPRGRFFGDGARLFSSDETGLSIWDAEKGSLTGNMERFQPTHQHQGARELVQLVERALVRWKTD
jgi:hypothetical protein